MLEADLTRVLNRAIKPRKRVIKDAKKIRFGFGVMISHKEGRGGPINQDSGLLGPPR